MEDQSVTGSLSCYICDDQVTHPTIRLINQQTQYTKSVFPLKIEQVMGEGFVVVVSTEDAVCIRCFRLVNLFDKLQSDLETVQTKLKDFLNIKYQLIDPTPAQTGVLKGTVYKSHSVPAHISDLSELKIKEEPTDTVEERPPIVLFKCKYCSYMTENKAVLQKHFKSHSKKVVYKCSVCQNSYNSRTEIEEHITVAHGAASSGPSSSQDIDVANGQTPRKVCRTFKCGVCFAAYSSKRELIVHFDSHRTPVNSPSIYSNAEKHVKNNIQSTDDGLNIETTKNGIASVRKHNTSIKNGSNLSKNAAECEYANNPEDNDIGNSLYTVNYEYIDSDLLSEVKGEFQLVQEKSHESPLDSKKSPGDSVSNSDDSIQNKIQNVSTQGKIYVCSICHIRSSSVVRMKRHLKSHIAQSNKIHICHICGKVLTTGSNLKRHISNHTSEPINCETCDETLSDRLHLKQHMEMLHPQTYCCSMCGEMVKSKQLLRNHELMHRGAKHFKCDINGCSDVFLRDLELKNHQTREHGILHENFGSKVYRCYICHKLLTTYHNLKRHLLTHKSSDETVFQCGVCQKELLNKVQMKRHYELCHPEVFPCGFCSEIFTTKLACKAHEETHPERLFYKCKFEGCAKVFPNERRLKRHIAVTHRDPKCSYCSKEISNMKKLIEHERRHERNKQKFPCTLCSRIFQTPSGLKYHQSSHTGKYNYYCDICNKGFNAEVVLAEHKASHTKEIRYTCDRCGRNFSANSTYRLHRLWHDNPLPYTCNICNRKFRHTSILSVHKRRVHTGERPYKCPQCPFTFNISSTLNKHLILHTKQYPYVCHICSKGFTTRTKIAKHLEKTHHDPSMVNEKPKPCEYKMVLRPDECSDSQVATQPVKLEDDPEEENSPPDVEKMQHDIANVSSDHRVFNMF